MAIKVSVDLSGTPQSTSCLTKLFAVGATDVAAAVVVFACNGTILVRYQCIAVIDIVDRMRTRDIQGAEESEDGRQVLHCVRNGWKLGCWLWTECCESVLT